MIVSKVISSITNGVRTLKVVCFGKRDVRTPAESAPYGYDGNPVEGIRAIYGETTTSGQDVIVGYVNKQQNAQPGESRMYSTDTAGTFKYNIWLTNTGDCLVGASDNTADYVNHFTQFEALKSALDSYFSALNTQIGLGVVSAGGTYTPPELATPVPHPFDMSASKLTHIKTT